MRSPWCGGIRRAVSELSNDLPCSGHLVACDERRRAMRPNRRRLAVEAFDLDEHMLAGRTLGEPRGPTVGGEHVRVAVRARRAAGRAGRPGQPGAGRQVHDTRSNVGGDDRAGEARASIVEHAHDIAVARCRARRRHRDGCGSARGRPPCRLAVLAGVELAVQTRRRLVGDQVQREALGPLAAQPLLGLEPRGMAGAVVVAERRRWSRRTARCGRSASAAVGRRDRPGSDRTGCGRPSSAEPGFARFPELVERPARRRLGRPTCRGTRRRCVRPIRERCGPR